MKYGTLFFLLLSCFALTSAGSPAEEKKARELLYRGLYQQIGTGDMRAAISTYNEIIGGSFSGREAVGEALVQKAICLEKLGKEEEALECYNRAIDDFSDNARVLERAFAGVMRFRAGEKPAFDREKELEGLVSQGVRYEMRGALADAEEQYRRALLLDPYNSQLQLRMALVCRKRGNYQDSIFYYRLAAGSGAHSGDFDFHKAMASCYKNLGDYTSAIKLWRSFAESDLTAARDRDRASFELELLYEQSDYAEARPIPWSLRVALARGEDLTREGQYLSAARVYLGARSEFAESYLPSLRLGFLHDTLLEKATPKPDKRDLEKKAIAFYEEALGKAPVTTAQRLRFRLALICERSGDLDRAASYMDQYFREDVRPVENDYKLRARIRKKRMWERVRTMKKAP